MKAGARTAVRAAIIAAAVGLVYSAAGRAGWLWDDDSYVTDNLYLRSTAGLGRIWLNPAGLLNYFPVKDTVQWLQWHAWGADPAGYHWTNVVLHLLSSFLLWRVLAKLGLAQAWLGGLLFAVHPVAVESVAWVSELKNTLSLPPLLLALGCRIDCERKPAAGPFRSRSHWLSVFWFLIAMLCKSTVVMFPVLLLLFAWWRHGRIRAADLRASAPFFVISLGLGLVEMSFEHNRAMLGFDASPAHGASPRAAAAGLSAAFYLCKCCFPFRLLPTYPRWPLDAAPIQLLPWLALGGLATWLWARRGTMGWAILGLGFFWLNLAPILGFVPMAYQRIAWVADHFAYLSLAGVAALAAAGADWLLERRMPRALSWLGLAAAGIALGWQSHLYAAKFESRRSLWTYTLQRNPASWAAHTDLGNLSVRSGRTGEAIAEFDQALAIEPDSAATHNNLAAVLGRTGRVTEAIREYETCLRLGADYAEIHFNLATALERTGRIPEAIAHYERALRLNPGLAQAHTNLGAIWANAGRLPEAIVQFQEGSRLDPHDSKAGADLGLALAQAGRFDEAIVQYRRVLALEPAYPDLHFELGNALLEAGQAAAAVGEYREALRLKPDDAEARRNLEMASRALAPGP